MSIVVGGIGQPGGGDLDFGRVALERLRPLLLGEHVVVEDLSPGVVDVAGRLQELRPRTLILVAASPRGRPPGQVERRLVGADEPYTWRVGPDAGEGTRSDAAPDHELHLALESGLGSARTVVVEVEPASVEPGGELSPQVEGAWEAALEAIRAEIRRAPLLDLAQELRDFMTVDPLEPTPVVEAVEALLRELEGLEREGRWGRTFAERDRLRLRISDGEHAGDFVGGLHWAMWWALMEELDRLQALEATSGPS